MISQHKAKDGYETFRIEIDISPKRAFNILNNYKNEHGVLTKAFNKFLEDACKQIIDKRKDK